MGRTVAGVEVLPTRNEARDRAWGIWLNRHPEIKTFVEGNATFRDWLGSAWGEAWHEASLDATRRNDQTGIIGLELARRLQEHVDLIIGASSDRDRGADPDEIEGLPF